jgi:hypothetical protein
MTTDSIRGDGIRTVGVETTVEGSPTRRLTLVGMASF